MQINERDSKLRLKLRLRLRLSLAVSKVSMRYARTQRAFKCNLSNTQSPLTARRWPAWRLSLLTLRRRRRRRFVVLALAFGNLDSFIWAALKTKRIRQIRNTTRPTIRQKYNEQFCHYNFCYAQFVSRELKSQQNQIKWNKKEIDEREKRETNAKYAKDTK